VLSSHTTNLLLPDAAITSPESEADACSTPASSDSSALAITLLLATIAKSDVKRKNDNAKVVVTLPASDSNRHVSIFIQFGNEE
jgi:hypothetical protein